MSLKRRILAAVTKSELLEVARAHNLKVTQDAAADEITQFTIRVM